MIFILYTQYYHHREEEEKRIEKEGQVVISKHCRILTELMVHECMMGMIKAQILHSLLH